MPDIKPQQIIDVFDRTLTYIYGSAYARENPSKNDHKTASAWISEGLDPVVAAWIFWDRMSWMHEKFLHHHDKADRTNIPGSLILFDENIRSAVRRVNTGSHEVDSVDRILSQWRARVQGWISKKIWIPEMWGPEPFQSGNRVPRTVLEEFSQHPQ
jgi:hypothetical protein